MKRMAGYTARENLADAGGWPRCWRRSTNAQADHRRVQGECTPRAGWCAVDIAVVGDSATSA
jgi:hypothetical protein